MGCCRAFDTAHVTVQNTVAAQFYPDEIVRQTACCWSAPPKMARAQKTRGGIGGLNLDAAQT
jgi:hypothetical protein